jgi:BirA family biotin operon repressor/biotin-[acetyl-CoA-carboxylase] ligase
MKLPPIGHSFTHFHTITSTNLYAMERIREGLAVHGEAIIADEQTAGRGQRGKKWHAEAGKNIQVSLVINMAKLAASQSFRLSACIALGVRDALQEATGHTFQIKWPNDLYLGDRKAGGILIENSFQAGIWQWAVAGIGINVNQTQFSPELPNPVSLAQVTGQELDVPALTTRICAHIDYRWQQLLDGYWPDLLADYNQALYGRGEQKRLRVNSAVTAYLVQRVNGQGRLVCGEMGEYVFDFGEVEWV